PVELVEAVDHRAPDAHPAPLPRLEEGTDYVVYRGDGSRAALTDLVSALDEVEVLFLGEEHDDRVGHRVQLEIFRRILVDHGGGGPMAGGAATPAREGSGPVRGEFREVVLSLEFFERDVQVVLDEYLAGLISEEHFLRSARPWDNYARDYRPLVELAKETRIPVVAANAPRRYVNLASREGREALSALSAEARRFLPPLPWPEASEAYRAEWDALMGTAAQHISGDPLAGQTLWDAAMGESIARALAERADGAPLVVHLAGGFHLERGTGIPEALDVYRPGTRVRIVAIRTAAEPGRFDPAHERAGDFVILTRELPPEEEGRAPAARERAPR
ncbi:MAG: ChaN family lipoprotein, partial [Longimicrobiales bacterium]|nr:ChaN family lipoprotein [Longimicrobiales bacterium]